MARSALSLLLVLVFSPAAATAQETTISEQISVELVNVDVHVTDRKGGAVAGLPREAFRIFDDGQPVAISHFQWVPPVADPDHREAPAASSAEPRRIALFFDDLQAGERSRAPLLGALYRELERGLAPEDRVSVVRFDGANLDVLLDGSADRGKLRRALEELVGYSAGQLRAVSQLRHAIGTLRYSIEDDPETCSLTGQLVRQYSQLVKAQVEASAEGLLRYAMRFGHEPGRRLLLHVSGGIPLVAGDDALAWAAERCDASAITRGISGPTPLTLDGAGPNASRGYWNPRSARLEIAEFSTAELWRDVAARVNALGVTLYPVLFGDAEGRFRAELRGGTMTDSAAFTARQSSRDALGFLADATGGLLIDAVADVVGGLERLAGDLGGYYSLAFQPAGPPSAGVRPIRVEIDGDGLRLRYRESYRLESREERIRFQLTELLAGERLDDPLALEIDVIAGTDAESEAAPKHLRIVVPFDRLALVDSPAGGREGRFTVYVAGRRAGGRLVAPRQRSIVARRAEPEARTFTYDVALPFGLGLVAVAVVDEHSGTVGYARHEIDSR